MMIKYKRIFLKNLWQLFGATIGLLLILDIRPCHSWPPLEQQSKQNVTCIAHDTKFTCDCRNANQPMQLPHLIGYVYQVEITNCPSLEVEAYALTETQGLRKVLFRDVKNLVLHENALAFPRTASNTALIIEFQQVSIKLMDSHAIDGNIEEISFVGGHIETIRPFGFTTVKERAVLLKMDRVWIRHIEPQAFKKFAVEDMEILNCVFEENLPSKSFYELEIKHALRIHNNRFKEVHTRAFSLKLVSKLSIVANNFVATDAEWIEAFISNALLISENQFGNTSAIAFKGLQVHRDYMRSEPLELKFLNNTLTSPYTLRPLEFNERFALQLKSLRYENVYDCSDLDRTQKPAVPSTTFFREHSDNIYFMDLESSSSSSQQANQRFLVLSKIIANDCQHTTYLWWIIGGVGLLVILLIVIIVIVCAVRGKRKRKRRKLDIVQPEPRTYTETQIVYQIETAGLIKTDL